MGDSRAEDSASDERCGLESVNISPVIEDDEVRPARDDDMNEDAPMNPVDVPRKKREIRPEKMKLRRGITMDTGAHHNVIPKRMIGNRKMRQSPGSRSQLHYLAAGKERIPNEGEIDFEFETAEGHTETFVFQVAEVNKALGSVAYVVDRAFRVVYDKNMTTGEDMSYMVHKPSGKTFRLRRDRNVWILDAIVGSETVDTVFSRPE